MKRFFALFMAVTISLSSAFSISADDKGLSEAITAAKQYISVPADRTQVDYDIREGKNGASIIEVSWSNDKGSTTAVLDKDGCLLSYSNNVYNRTDRKGLAKLSGDKTRITADSFLKTVYGKNASYFKLDYADYSRYSHTYNYSLFINDIRVSNGKVNISVDPDTGELNYFNGIGKEFFELNYPKAQGVIGVNKAMKAFYDGKAPLPEYQIATNYKDRTITKKAFLAFSVYDTLKAVNAFSGEITSAESYFDELNARESASTADGMADNEKGSGYTAEEIAAIDHAEGLISAERASEIIKTNFPVAKNIDFNTSSIYKDSYEENYLITIGGDKARASLDAKTGKITNFNYYEDSKPVPIQPRAEINTEEKDTTAAKATAKALIEKIAPAESKKTAEPTTDYSNYDNTTRIAYNRVENGYLCKYNSLYVTVNDKGEVIGYTNSFDTKLAFPKPVNVLAEDDAINALAEVFNFELAYSVDESYKASLVYHFNNGGTMDYSSKTMLNYKGEPEEESKEPGISDIKGHWCEKYVTALYSNGYKLNDTLFRPDKAITMGELRTLFNNYDYKPYYINEYGEASDDNKTLTRYELADYILNYMGLEKIKDYPEILAKPAYTDDIKAEYLPAVAISTAMGALSSDENGSFNGTKEVTRAEAAVALYNILSSE